MRPMYIGNGITFTYIHPIYVSRSTIIRMPTFFRHRCVPTRWARTSYEPFISGHLWGCHSSIYNPVCRPTAQYLILADVYRLDVGSMVVFGSLNGW